MFEGSLDVVGTLRPPRPEPPTLLGQFDIDALYGLVRPARTFAVTRTVGTGGGNEPGNGADDAKPIADPEADALTRRATVGAEDSE